ncbi:uncharacterized protein TNCV_238731 [Trichonephila clavipes]|nr:uncharacterized protein TNCV_238731 [Trichonephila clavipes]
MGQDLLKGSGFSHCLIEEQRRVDVLGEPCFSFFNYFESRSAIQDHNDAVGVSDICPFKGLGSNPGEDTNVCKCMPLRHGGTLNTHQAAILLVKLGEGEERWEASDHPQSILPLNWGEPSQIVLSPVWCSTLRLMTGVT